VSGGHLCAKHRSTDRGGSREIAPAEVSLTPLGKIANAQIEAIPLRHPFVEVQKYVIMPNHIHILVFIDGFSAGASPRPTLSDIICSFKSLATRESKKFSSAKTIWQTSFYEHIIRDDADYTKHYDYIENNPALWLLGGDEI
jgi:REP element-mobilizing transposase RayT